MSIIINSNIGSTEGFEPSTGPESTGDSSAASSSELSQLIQAAFKDGTLDGNELKALQAFAPNQNATSADESSQSSSESFEASESSDSGELTPQEFMSELTDKVADSTGFGDGEETVLDLGKKLMNASPQQQQAFLDKVDEYLSEEGEDDDYEGNIDTPDAKELSAFVDGLMSEGSESAEGTDGADESGNDSSFMDKVDELLAESQKGNEGTGETMAREAAEMLEDNPVEDQEAFLEQLEKFLNNADGDYDKDIDEKGRGEENSNEGTMLKKFAEALEELPSDRGESSMDGSDAAESGNEALRNFLDKASSGGFDNSELLALRELVGATSDESIAA
jgi:hypothetical protein